MPQRRSVNVFNNTVTICATTTKAGAWNQRECTLNVHTYCSLSHNDLTWYWAHSQRRILEALCPTPRNTMMHGHHISHRPYQIHQSCDWKPASGHGQSLIQNDRNRFDENILATSMYGARRQWTWKHHPNMHPHEPKMEYGIYFNQIQATTFLAFAGQICLTWSRKG